jgi:hypothetical protein
MFLFGCSITGSLNKIPTAIAGLLFFNVPTTMLNILSISVGEFLLIYFITNEVAFCASSIRPGHSLLLLDCEQLCSFVRVLCDLSRLQLSAGCENNVRTPFGARVRMDHVFTFDYYRQALYGDFSFRGEIICKN